MAIGWLALLKVVPWVEVVRNAPQVVDEAKKLWKAVAKKSPAFDAESQANQSALVSDDVTIESLQARLAALESASAELHKQLLASSEIITELAEQNTQLIKRVDLNRKRLFWLAATTFALALAAAIYLI